MKLKDLLFKSKTFLIKEAISLIIVELINRDKKEAADLVREVAINLGYLKQTEL